MADVADHQIEVHLVTPERELYSGEADLVIARTTEGDLGVMANHAPLLGALAIGPLTIVNGNDRTRAVVDGGFLHVKDNRVDVLAEFAEFEDEVDVSSARSRVDEMRSRLGDDASEEDKAELRKAEARASLGDS
jgi:F-type H+-transporting ATPase subunit epsilon